MKNKEIKNILDQVTAGIRSEEVDSKVVSEATGRGWAQLSGATDARRMRADRPQDAGAPIAGAPGRIEGCADFQSLIPVYLRGELSEPRSLLLIDHTHECIPCRKALKQARQPEVALARSQERVRPGRPRSR